MDNGGMPDNWTPTPPPTIGGLSWKRDIVERSIKDKFNGSCRSYDCGEVGVFCVERCLSGWNYFWVEKENHKVLPDIDWKEMAKLSIAQ